MNRVCIVGCSCSGKSLTARRLGDITRLPVHHLDAYYLKEGWAERTQEEWFPILNGLLRGEQWIIDGDYSKSQDVRFAKADTVIFLDLPRYRCLLNSLKRPFIYRKKRRIDVPEGCNETFDFEFYKWIWSYKNGHRAPLIQRLEKLKNEKDIVVLKNYRQINRYLEKVKRVIPPNDSAAQHPTQ